MKPLGSAVLHQIRGEEALDALADRVAQLQQNGLRALVVTVLHPVRALLTELHARGDIDVGAVAFIDCTGERQHDEPGDDVMYVESPTMMETILMRTDRLLRRMGPDAAVVVHTLDAFAMYAPRGLVLEFATNLVHNLRPKGFDVELLCNCSEPGDRMARGLESLVDVTLTERARGGASETATGKLS